jgi:hypothetical protein
MVNAIRLNLTRGDGEDRVRVIEPRPDDRDLSDEAELLRGRLPENRTLRLQVLAHLMWADLTSEAESVTDAAGKRQKIEWVRLWEMHRDLFNRAKEYEEQAVQFGEQFYWCKNESLAELERPERMQQIKDNWDAAQARARAKRRNVPLVDSLGGLEPQDDPSLRDGCLICSL